MAAFGVEADISDTVNGTAAPPANSQSSCQLQAAAELDAVTAIGLGLVKRQVGLVQGFGERLVWS